MHVRLSMVHYPAPFSPVGQCPLVEDRRFHPSPAVHSRRARACSYGAVSPCQLVGGGEGASGVKVAAAANGESHAVCLLSPFRRPRSPSPPSMPRESGQSHLTRPWPLDLVLRGVQSFTPHPAGVLCVVRDLPGLPNWIETNCQSSLLLATRLYLRRLASVEI